MSFDSSALFEQLNSLTQYVESLERSNTTASDGIRDGYLEKAHEIITRSKTLHEALSALHSYRNHLQLCFFEAERENTEVKCALEDTLSSTKQIARSLDLLDEYYTLLYAQTFPRNILIPFLPLTDFGGINGGALNSAGQISLQRITERGYLLNHEFLETLAEPLQKMHSFGAESSLRATERASLFHKNRIMTKTSKEAPIVITTSPLSLSLPLYLRHAPQTLDEKSYYYLSPSRYLSMDKQTNPFFVSDAVESRSPSLKEALQHSQRPSISPPISLLTPLRVTFHALSSESKP